MKTVGQGSLCAFLVLAAVASASCAELKLGRPFSDGCVLQCERPVPVWGQAAAGDAVRVDFAGQVRRTVADAQGRWRVTLDPLTATGRAQTLTVATQKGGAPLTVEDVLVGEVWLCSGQSNMAMALVHPELTRYRDAIGAMMAQTVDEPNVRYLDAPGAKGWMSLTHGFLQKEPTSALAVHYALELRARLHVPIGVIVAAVGGSNIDDWQAGGYLDKIRLAEICPYALRGALWYQGETNLYLGETDAYQAKLRRLYDGWRARFENPSFRLDLVQLAPFARGTYLLKDGTAFDYDAAFPRFLQAQAAFVDGEPNATLTVINDLGTVHDIHPNEKERVAKRLALHALRRDYGRDWIEDQSPRPSAVTVDGDRLTVAFSHAKSLYAYQRFSAFSARDVPFELAGADGAYRPAEIVNWAKLPGGMREGMITNAFVILRAPGLAAPQKVRYAWRYPWTGCVYNEVNLPLGTFEVSIHQTRHHSEEQAK